jgi:serine/threonine protein kinase
VNRHRAGEAARREAAALAGLRHPNILAVYDVLDDAEGVWLIEQWITGAQCLHAR